MKLRSIFTLLALTSAPSAFAASDLTTAISGPATQYVYESGTFTVTVNNIGNQSASNVTVAVQLPVTNTYPVAIMGTLGSRSSGCTLSGSVMTCSLGTIARKKSASATFAFTFPESTQALGFTATAATSSAENSTSNNSSSYTAVLENYDVTFTPPRQVLNEHCTGTNLTSYYECTLFPSSISSFVATFNSDGTITVPGYSTILGYWHQTAPDALSFEYYDAGELSASFEGYGVSSTCWEGATYFPNSTYMSMYRVCLQ